MLSLSEFESFARDTPAEKARPKPYLASHILRFYETYKTAASRLKSGDTLLSVGAGRAFVECVLAKHHGIKVTVFDFPETIDRNADQYEAFGFRTLRGNFLDEAALESADRYDCALFCEIVEHIPMPPVHQFSRLRAFLKPGGALIVTTPNIGSADHIIALLRGQNILPGADKLFSEISAENESIHRREYTPSEITAAMEKSGLTPVDSRYMHQGKPRNRPKSRALFALTRMVPRLRTMQIAVGVNR